MDHSEALPPFQSKGKDNRWRVKVNGKYITYKNFRDKVEYDCEWYVWVEDSNLVVCTCSFGSRSTWPKPNKMKMVHIQGTRLLWAQYNFTLTRVGYGATLYPRKFCSLYIYRIPVYPLAVPLLRNGWKCNCSCDYGGCVCLCAFGLFPPLCSAAFIHFALLLWPARLVAAMAAAPTHYLYSIQSQLHPGEGTG